MVYLGILDTRKYFGSQKILSKITSILSRISILLDKYGCLVVKMVLRDIYSVPKFLTETVNNVSPPAAMDRVNDRPANGLQIQVCFLQSH